jgi:hypothetical protein
MKLNIAKTRVVSYTRKTNFLSYEYQLCHAIITRTSSIKALGVFFDSKLHFRSHDVYAFSECIKLLGIICPINYRFSSLEYLYVLYLTLVGSKLEHAPSPRLMPISLSASSRSWRRLFHRFSLRSI